MRFTLIRPSGFTRAKIAELYQNRSRGGGSVGSLMVVQSPADGYTILVCNNANLIFNTFIYQNLGYSPSRDLAPLGVSAPNCAV
jgi:tripartite-type tricarboxylate transporter receptor subunit TctC